MCCLTTTNEKPLVYMASPYSDSDRFLNTMAAVAMYRQLLKEDVVNPVCPLLSGLIPAADDIPWDRWMEVDLAIMRKCDAVFSFNVRVNEYYLAISRGRAREVIEAKNLGIPVFTEKKELYVWAVQFSQPEEHTDE